MQTLEKVTKETRIVVVLFRIVTVLWIIALVNTYLHPLKVYPLDYSLVTDASTVCVQFCVFLSLVAFLVGELTGNVSQVDRWWSLSPTCFIGITCWFNPSPRLLLMLLLASLWSVRLTWNFWRRGGYSWPLWSGHEDYRWVYVRKWPVLNTSLGWSLFNLIFISIYQNFLLLGTVAPSFVVAASGNKDLNVIDVLAAISFITCFILETYADNQQEDFQNSKKMLLKNKEQQKPFDQGFISWGLFSISRHPNYLAEQSLWVIFYFFSVAASGVLFNITLIGSLALILLFQGSTALSESITGGKYKKYQEYCQTTPRFIGNFLNLKQSYC